MITEQDLPEHGRDWVQFWGFENFPMDPALLGHSLVIQTQMLMDDVSWLEEEPVISSSYTMMYPVFLTDEIILGRMDNCILASTGGDQMGKVVEERVCIVIRGDGIYGFFSVLYDSDYVATFSLNLVHVFSGSSSKIAMYNRYTPNTRMIIMEYHETIECTFCQHRNMRCECTSLMQSRSLVGSTYHKEARRVSDTTNSYRTWESFVGFFTRILKRQRSRLTVMTSAGGKTAASVPTMRLQSTYFFKGPIVSALTMRHAQCLLKKRRPYNVILKLDAPGEYNHADKGQSVQVRENKVGESADICSFIADCESMLCSPPTDNEKTLEKNSWSEQKGRGCRIQARKPNLPYVWSTVHPKARPPSTYSMCTQ